MNISAASRYLGPLPSGLSVFWCAARSGAFEAYGFASTKGQAVALAVAALESGVAEMIEDACAAALQAVRFPGGPAAEPAPEPPPVKPEKFTAKVKKEKP